MADDDPVLQNASTPGPASSTPEPAPMAPRVCAVAPGGITTISPRSPMTRADWNGIALTKAFGASTAQEILNDPTVWFTGAGASFQANKDIIHAVYDYYGALYARNPGKCIWAGLGRVAGGPFFWGFGFIDSAIQQLTTTLQALDAADMCAKQPETWVERLACALRDPQEQQGLAVDRAIFQAARDEFQASIEALMTMGKNIFFDLAWQHEAYLAKGLSEILRLGAQNGIFDPNPDLQQSCLDCWKSIDADDPASAQKGNLSLFQREQLVTISPGYAKLTRLLGVPTVMSFLASRPHPWGQNFWTFFHMGFTLPPWGEDPAARAARWSSPRSRTCRRAKSSVRVCEAAEPKCGRGADVMS